MSEKDVQFTSYRSSGPGGQNVNKLSTAVRLVHKKTGETVSCQEERHQRRNRDKALKKLNKKLRRKEKRVREKKEKEERRNQIGSASRESKIRTYNYKYNLVVNHKTGKKIKKLTEIVDKGRLDLIQ